MKNSAEITFNQFFNNSIDLQCITDLEGHFIKVNPEWEKTLGYSSNDLEGRGLLEIVHSDDLGDTSDALKELVKHKRVDSLINKCRHKDGKYQRLEWRANSNGNEIYASARVISELKSTELDTADIKQLHQIVIDTIDAGLFFARNSKFLWVNKTFLNLINATHEDIIGKPLSVFFKGDTPYEKIYKQAINSFAKTERFYFEIKLEDKSGINQWYSLVGKALYPNSPQGGTVWVVQNITKKKQTEDQLRKFKHTSDYAQDAILWVNKEAGIEYANIQACKSLGYSGEDITKMKIFDIDYQFSKDQFDKDWEKGSKSGYSNGLFLESQQIRSDGTIFPVEVLANHFYFEDEDLFVAHIRDISIRKKNEQELFYNQKLLKESQRVAKITSWENNIKEGTIKWQEGTYSIFGYDYEEMELSSESFLKIIHQDDIHYVKSIYDRILNLKEFIDHEYRIIRKDGEIRNILVVGDVSIDDRGNVYRTYGIMQDITERKLNEKALIESESKARLFVENTPLPIAMFDTEMCYLLASNRWYTDYRLGDQDIIGRSHYDVFPEVPDRWKEDHKRVLKGEVFKNAADKFIRLDGTVQWLRYELRPWYKSDKSIGGIVMFTEDITEEIESEKALIESKQKLESLVRVVPVGIGIVVDRILSEVNPKICLITGYNKEELLGMSTRFLYINNEEYERVGNILLEQVNEKGAGQIESIWKRKDGKLIDIYLATTPIDKNDHLKGVTFTVQDITERKRYEEALEKRVLALTRPVDDIKSIEFTDLFNLNDLQKIQDSFAKATGVASIITYPDGKPITKPSNFTDFCKLIRCSEKGNTNCAKSDALLGKINLNKKPNIQPCLSAGLWDAGASISIGGVHVANWLIGQIRNEDLTEEKIITYADELGVNRDEFRAAYQQVPVMSKEQFKNVAEALINLSNEISLKSYQNIQQARFISEQKEAEKQLIEAKLRIEESETRYRALHNASFGGISIHDKGIILDCNQGLSEMTGYTHQELIGMNGLLLIDEDFRDTVIGHIKDGYEKPYEVNAIRKNREVFPVRIEARNIPYKGKIVRSTEFRDITQDKIAERELIKAKERAEQSEYLLFESQRVARIGSVKLLLNSSDLEITETYRDILGVDGGTEITQKFIFDMIAPEFKVKVQKEFEAKRNTQGPFSIEYPIIRKNDGERRWLLSTGTFNADESGQILEYIGTVQDITERKYSEETIKASEERFRALAENVPGSIYMCLNDANFTMLYLNDEVENITGYKKETFLTGKIHITDMYHKQDALKVTKLVDKALSNKNSFELTYRIKHKNGTWRWIQEFGTGIYHENELDYLIGFFIDITEKKNAEDELKKLNVELEQRVEQRTGQLKQANADLKAFVYSVSHDLRAPLRHIEGFLKLLHNTIKPIDEKAENYIDKIFGSSNYMTVMIEELLKFSRLGRTDLGIIEVSLNDIVNDILERLKPDYANRKIKWLVSTLPKVKCDPYLLKIAIENIISNALKYTSKIEFAQIEIGLKKSDKNEVCFFVKDNGAGFDMKYKDKLFGVFQRLHTNEEFEGVGIGLANAKQIIQKHNGSITATSAINEGATFFISLPN